MCKRTIIWWQFFRLMLSSCGNSGDCIPLPSPPNKRIPSITGADDFATIAADTMKISGGMKQSKMVS